MCWPGLRGAGKIQDAPPAILRARTLLWRYQSWSSCGLGSAGVALAISRARTSLTTVLCSFSSVSHAWVSGMGMSRKFRLRCNVRSPRGQIFRRLATYVERRLRRASTTTRAKQVFNGTEISVLCRFSRRTECARIEISPLGRHQRATSIRQNYDQM